MEEAEDFNEGLILPPLLIQLRKILDQYPDDSQILKELIQNAEDANAREIKFLYDKHTYDRDTRKLHHPELRHYQGPALYVHNDGVFDDDDWRGIRMLSQSIKQDDPLKVGYFGMGFKSVFHLTDLPFILSGDKLGAIDPHQSCFPASSFAWSLKRQDLLTTLSNQVAPFIGHFDITEQTFLDGQYNGTLFRFPLRNSPSKLCDTVYSPDRIRRLFESFKQDAHLVLLFLMHLECVEFYERDEKSLTPRLTFRVQLSDECLFEVQQKRTEFLNQTRSDTLPNRPLVTTYPIEIETVEICGNDEVKERFSFLVTNYFSGSQVSAVFRKLYRDSDLRFPPWVGTALPLDGPSSNSNEAEEEGETKPYKEGLVFCFLPLPIEGNTATGLPVHVNGFFALEQNRKYIKMPGSYRTRDDLMDKRLLWNNCMLREALPKAYTHLILGAIKMYNEGSHVNISVETIYRAFPDFSKVDRKWDIILPPLFAEILQQKVIYTSALGGRWVEPRQAVFNTLDQDDEARDIILEILETGDVNIADAPPHVLQAIRTCCRLLNGTITPSLVSQTYQKIQNGISLTYEDRIKILRYFLKQLKYDLLEGLELLPLANGSFNQFFYNPRRADRTIYIPSDVIPKELLPGLEEDFLDPGLDPDVKALLVKAANRGYTQLKQLDASAFATLLPRCLPSSWMGQKHVQWRPKQAGQPPASWIQVLWTYLVRHCPNSLQSFETIPMVPLGAIEDADVVELVPLAAAGPIIAKELNGQSLPKGLDKLLETLGVIVVDQIPDFITVHPAITRRYVFSPTYIGVLQAMSRIVQNSGLSYLAETVYESTTDENRRDLREFFNKISKYELTEDIQGVLACLPVLETVQIKGESPRFVAFDKVNLAAPAEKIPVKLSQDVLDMEAPNTANLAHVLGVRILTVADLLIEVVFPDLEAAFYDPDEVQRLMVFVLRHYYSFTEENPNFQEAVKSLPFMPRNGILLTAERFYDPDDQLLQKIFFHEENFPTGVYGDPTIVTVLRQIGIRGLEAVESEDLFEACNVVQDMAEGRVTVPTRSVEMKSDAIMDYLEKHVEILEQDCDRKLLKECISDVAWVRRLTQKPSVYPRSLPWFTADVKFHKPCEMTHKMNSSIAGSVIPVVAKDDIPDAISENFGWLSSPGAEHLVNHLANAVNSFSGTEKAMYLETTRAIYTHLSNHPTDLVQSLLEKAKLTEWVWHGDGFTSPQQVVFRQPFMNLNPFVYTFPAELLPFSEFFRALGAQESCHLPNVLKQIKAKHESAEVNHNTPSEVKMDLHLCVTILNELKSNVTEDTLPALQDELVLPLLTESSFTLKMAPLHDCTYCDQEWTRQGYDLGFLGEEEDSLLLVHPNLPIITSQVLDVPTLMSRMLEAEELDFSFGQTDSLTHRLHVLLAEYVDGFAVPKELVQNADDAGATCLKILYDERANLDCRTCLIDEGMRECQGPALWAYNDAVFTDQDFDNITKLSGATKEEMTDKIGRFGLGFNAVYNITDVPSFISRHNIVIFDPHTTHLGKSIKNKSKPGIKIDVKKHRRKLKRLTNQFKPYNGVFGCNLGPESEQDSFDGTLFRLPLRTKTQAVNSEICQRHYDDKEVKILLDLLIKGAESLLLFTQNVVEISLFHLPAHGRSPADANQIFTINKRCLQILKELKPVVPLPVTAKNLDKSKVDVIKQSTSLKASAKVIQDIKAGLPMKTIETPNAATLISLEQRLTDNGSRFFRCKPFQQDRPWLVTSYMGYEDALQMALPEQSLVPVGGVAVPLEHQESSDCFMPLPILDKDKKPNGAAFTYLPLPVHSGLPVHINGAFTVTSNRRYLCEHSEEDKFDIRAIWNDALLRDPVAQAYISLLKHLSTLAPQPGYEYNLLWPQPQQIETSCHSLMTSFYKELSQDENTAPKLFSDGMKWVNIHKTCSLGEDLLNTSVKSQAMEVFRICSDELPIIVTEIPPFVREGFQISENLESVLTNTHDVKRFFIEIFLPNILSAPSSSRDKLMINVLTSDLDPTSELFTAIQRRCCIPVSPDATELKLPTEIVDPESSLARLYAPQDGRFPHSAYRTPEVLLSLRTLGMATSEISWDELIIRAENVSGLDPDKSRVRIIPILDCIQTKLESNGLPDEELQSYGEKFQQIAWLPVMKRPDHFPLKWYGEELGANTLLAPAQAFSADHRSLVGCIEPVIDESVFPHMADNVRHFLGLDNKEPTIEQILRQLEIISDQETEQYLKQKDTNNEIFKTCFAIYTFLQSKCSDEEFCRSVAESLQNRYFLLCQDRFLTPKQMAFDFDHNCSPYMYAVPELYKRNFAELLTVVGVPHQFETKDFVLALRSMHDTHNNDVLSKESLKLALQMVNLLNDSMQDLNQTLSNVVVEFGAIYIPDAAGVLRASSELCFNEPDCQWVPTTGYANYSHAHIPFAISKQLGVNTKRQEVLKKHSRGIPFGQRERLPIRLKRILSSYPCDKEILKELLQNADDAGATEIHFIKDPRQHGTERVFDDSWKPLQGPALCVFNNRPFNDTDLKGIQRLGEGSKGTDPNKTGQYGVGFNCVYHLTDAPSFLTSVRKAGQNLCIFDPQAKYVPGATLEEPGRRYEEVSELRQIFSDVFPCYLENMYDLSNGTMFRLPLRTEAMAAESELSEQAISLPMLDTLFDKFRQEIFDCLLFVNNITSITLTEVDSRKGTLVNTYTVKVQMSEEDVLARKEFSEYLSSLAGTAERGILYLSQIQKRSVSYKVTLTDTNGYYEKWLVNQHIGFKDSSKVPQSLNDVYRRQELALLPRGGAAALLDSSDPDRANRPKKAFCFLPLPLRTDLPVHINGHFALDHEARRNLWQDDDTGTKTEWNYLLLKEVIAPAYVSLLRRLPSHLNASSAGLNLSLMEMFGDNVPSVDLFVDLLPRFRNTNAYWISLVENIYRYIHDSEEAVLPVVRPCGSFFSLTRSSLDLSADETGSQAEVEWLSTSGTGASKPYFDNLEQDFLEEDELNISGSFLTRKRLTSTPKKTNRRDTLRKVLLSSGYKLLKLPLDILECFHRSGVPVEAVSPQSVTDFFKSYTLDEPFCTIGALPCDIAATPFRNVNSLKVVLEYCSQGDETFYNDVDGIPLLLTQDGQLRQFSTEDPVYLSQYHELLPSLSSMFTNQTLSKTVLRGVNVDTCSVFLRFDIPSFSGLLMNELPEYAYKTEDKHTLWAADTEKLPTPRWVWMLWSFLSDEYERILVNQPNDVDTVDLAKSILKPLRHWCLLPTHVVTGGQANQSQHYFSGDLDIKEQYLIPIGVATTSIDYTNASIMSYPVRECLRKLGITEIQRKLLDGSKNITSIEDMNAATTSDFASLIVASLEKPATVLNCLNYVAQRSWKEEQLHVEEFMTILKYFNDSLDVWKDDKQSREDLRKLPLFFTVHGDIRPIGSCEAYVLPNDIPQAKMDAWEDQKGIVFLRSNPALIDLYTALDCKFLSVTEVYSKFIFKNFEFLDPEARIIHMQFIKDVKLAQLRGEEREMFIDNLRALEFLEDEDGILRQAFHFHDPHHPVYKVMLEGQPSAFPPPPYSEFRWLAFLKSIGLKHEVTPDRFVEFAEGIANEAPTSSSEDTFKKSRALVTHLFSRNNVIEEELLERVSTIKFIPAAKCNKTLVKLATPYEGEAGEVFQTSGENNQVHISFKEGIQETHEELVWTSSYLLPDWANPFKLVLQAVSFNDHSGNEHCESFEKYQKEIARQLAVQEDPSAELVVEHVKKVCSVARPEDKGYDDFHAYMKMTVMKRVYKYLQGIIEESDVARNKLKDTKCIVVDLGQTFVKPKQVVINLYEEDQIIPFLYKAPTELGEFQSLFMHLGATLHTTADQYAMVLESIHHVTGDAKLHPNEMRAAFKAVHELFMILEKHPRDGMYSEILHLPSTNGRLIRSTDLVFNDDPSYTDRIKHFDKPFLVDLSECKLKARNYEDMVKLLPRHLRPAMLTSLVREVLEPECTGYSYDYGVIEKLKHQLTSRAFSNGVVRLIRHEHRRSGHKVKAKVMDRIQEDLKKIQVVAMDRVITYLTYEQDKIMGSSSEGDCFVERVQQSEDEDDSAWNIYLTNSVSMNEELLVSLADVVNKIVNGLLANSVHYLQPVLSCPPHSISRVLDRLKVRPDHSIDYKTATLPAPGSFIPIEDHHLLKEDFENFEPGEYIGFELDDDESGHQTFIYAVILEKIIEETMDHHGVSKLSQKYKVCVGEDHKAGIALATDLYKFHRVGRFRSRSSISDGSFHIPHTPTSADSGSRSRYRDSFYEQSSIFEPATPTVKEVIGEGKSKKTRNAKDRVDHTNGKTPHTTEMPSTEDTTPGSARSRRHYRRWRPEPEPEPEEEEEEEPDYIDVTTRTYGKTKFQQRRRMKKDRMDKAKSRAARVQQQGPPLDEEDNQTNGFFKARQHDRRAEDPAEDDYVYNSEGEVYMEEEGYGEDQHQFNYNREIEITDSSSEFENHRTRIRMEKQRAAGQDHDQEDGVEENPTKVLDDISDTLEEAWKLPESQKKKIIKRLLLKWHPDKNIGSEEEATAVTQHIQSEIERLELGLPRPGRAEEFAKDYQFDFNNPFSQNENFQKNFYNAYQFFYEQMNRRAKEQREQRERYKENLNREYSDQYNFDVPPSFSSSNPQPAQAKRFLKQAQEDLRAADNDYDVKEPAFEWVCFKSHQAAEKALKAAQFSVDAVSSFSHDLASLAATIEDIELRRLSVKLQRIVGDSNKLYNPDPIDFVIIPHDEYSKETACDAIMCAADILERVKEFVETRERF